MSKKWGETPISLHPMVVRHVKEINELHQRLEKVTDIIKEHASCDCGLQNVCARCDALEILEDR